MSGKKSFLINCLEVVEDDLIYDHALIFCGFAKRKIITFDYNTRVNYRRHHNTVTKYGVFIPNGFLNAIYLRILLIKILFYYNDEKQVFRNFTK